MTNNNLNNKINTTSFHKVPSYLKETLLSNPNLLNKWNSLTPLARNEWVCWLTIPKKIATKEAHLHRFQRELLSGKKRPCCWPGCPHRLETAKKWFK